MRIFLYEYITGGGLLSSGKTQLDALLPEGEAMLAAIASDIAAITGIQLTVLRDRRFADMVLPHCSVVEVHSEDQERACLEQLAKTSDAGILIAPEINGILADRVQWIEAASGHLISPDSEFVTLASNKISTNQRLAEEGIRVPVSRRLPVPEHGSVQLPHDFTYPAVVKRIDGSGSLGMQVRTEPACCLLDPQAPWMIEEFCPGIPVSAAFLCGPKDVVSLPPFHQQLDTETFQYLGGSRLMDPHRAARATELARDAVEIIGRPTGYVGVDLVSGDDPRGRNDYVIEINPRLTTSYIGIRALTNDNLAEAMLAVARGSQVALSFRNDPVHFTVHGHIHPPGCKNH